VGSTHAVFLSGGRTQPSSDRRDDSLSVFRTSTGSEALVGKKLMKMESFDFAAVSLVLSLAALTFLVIWRSMAVAM